MEKEKNIILMINNGKGYNSNGLLEFETKGGKGYIKEFNLSSGELEFEWEYLNGEKNGKGKEYDDDKLYFKGDIWMGKEMEKEKNIILMVN